MNEQPWFRPYVKAYFWRFLIIVVLGLLTILSASSLMFVSGFLITKSALRPENILLVYVPIVGVRAFSIGRAVIHYVERLVGHDAVLRILSAMRVRLYDKLEPQALFLRSRYRTGDILGVLSDDVEHLQDVYIRTIFPSVIAIVMYAVAIVTLGRFDGTFALLMALYIFILVAVLPFISVFITRKKHTLAKEERNGLYQKLTDSVLGIGDWVISGRSSQFVESYEADEEHMAQLDRKLRSWARWRGFISQLVVALVVISMLYWSGAQYAEGRIDVTLIAAFVLMVFPLMDAFLPVSEAVEKLPQYQDSLQRLNRISDSAGSTEYVEAQNAHQADVQNVLKTADTEQGAHIQMHNVSYSYEGDVHATIKDVSIDVPQGKKIAIIGRSGAGKSTLLKLIQGAVSPGDGQVTINGVDALYFGDTMSQLISVLNQSPHLFDTTIGNNIRLGHINASDEEIRHAGSQAQLDALIQSLPEGYDTPMRETGGRFSGGERQRVALARILLQDTPVIILDEPTVGLDPRTENDLLRTILSATEGKSLIWVTHHLVGAEQMDEIIFMDNGQVIMRGTHAELMEQYPRYRNLYFLDRPDMARGI